jgi:hypothetical protein
MHYGGPGIQDLYEHLLEGTPFPQAAPDQASLPDIYTHALNILNANFSHRSNVHFERQRFRKLSPFISLRVLMNFSCISGNKLVSTVLVTIKMT